MYLAGPRSIYDERFGDAPDYYSSSLYKVQSGWVSYGAISPSYDYDRYEIDLGFTSGRFSIKVTTDPTNRPVGTTWLNGFGSLRIEVLNQSGFSVFDTYTVSGDATFTMDWLGTSDWGKFTLKLSGYSATNYALTASPLGSLNTAPVATNANWTVDEDAPATSQLPAATDAEGNPFTYSLATRPLHGGITVAPNGTVTYLAFPDYFGSDSFQYNVTDSLGASNTYTVSVTVRPVNDAPIAIPKSYTGQEDTLIVGTIGATDVDSPSVTLRVVTQPKNGSVTLGANGAFTYSPNKDFFGADSFSYLANDGIVDSASPAVVTLTVLPVNDPPVVTSPIPDLTATARAPFTFIVLANAFTDSDSPQITLSATQVDGSPLPAWLTFNATSRTFAGTPLPQDVGSISIRVTASDGSATASDEFQLRVLAGENSLPTSSSGNASTLEDSPLSGTLPAANDADGDRVVFEKSSDPSHGTVTVGASGSYLYAPAANYSGVDAFNFKVNDGKGGVSTYPMTITVRSVVDTFVGSDGPDEMAGYPGPDIYRLGGGDDIVTGGGGDDEIDGGPGIDVAVYGTARAGATIAKTSTGFSVTSALDGSDSLTNIERLKFSDVNVALDMSDAGHGGQTAKILGALFGRQFLANKDFVGIGLDLLDKGTNYAELVGLAVQTEVFAQLAGSRSNADFVRFVYKNVVGATPSQSDLNELVGLLDSGTYTQATLAFLACETEANKLQIDLVGLASSGIEYAEPFTA